MSDTVEQQRLFDRFFRSSLAQHQASPGSGPGLSIAHTIVEKHGGTLEVCSEAGPGLDVPSPAAGLISQLPTRSGLFRRTNGAPTPR